MVVGFLREAACQSTPKRSKTIAAQRLSSTSQCSEPGPAGYARHEPTTDGGSSRSLTFALGAKMTAQLTKTAVQLSAQALVLLLSAGCASYWVRYDKQQTCFQKGSPHFDKTGQELVAGKTPCSGGLDVVREHGLFWWPGGFYRHEDDYGIYFKKAADSSRDFYLTMSQHDQWPQVVEARGDVVVAGHSVSIDIEYRDAKGRWRTPPINGVRKIDWVLPDDAAVPVEVPAEASHK
jgi:hypothetical protein